MARRDVVMSYSQLPLHKAGSNSKKARLEGQPVSGRAANSPDLLAYTSSRAVAKVQPATTSYLEIAEAKSRKFSIPERLRAVLAVLVTLLYLGVLAWMFYLSNSSPDVGLSVSLDNSGRWIVSDVVPSGLGYDAGVRPGDILVAVDGKPVGPASFTGQSTVDLSSIKAAGLQKAGAPSQQIFITTQNVEALDPVRRWAFALLGLIFIGVGGPVYAKARQRTAAAAFYAFCLFSALGLAIAPVSFLLNGWVLAAMFVAIVMWAGSFAYFFMEFPVPIGQTRARHALIVSGLMSTAALLLIAYAWSYTSNSSSYAWVQLFQYIYLAACVGLGLGRLIWLQIAEQAAQVREQLRLLLVGTGLAVGPGLLLTVLPMILFGNALVRVEIASLSLGIMPLAFAYAITQHQVLGMRGFLRRGVIYIVMGTTVLFVFSLGASALGSLFDGWEKSEWGLIGFGLFVFVIALTFSFVQRRVERMVDRYIYHDSYDYKEALLSFSAQLAAEQNLQVLADKLVERTCKLMNLTCGVLLLSSKSSLDQDTALSVGIGLDTTSKLRRRGNGSNGKGRGAKGHSHARSYSAASPAVALDDSSVPAEGEKPYLTPYSEYGEGADWLVERLAEELAQLGVAIQRVDSPTQIRSLFGRITSNLVRTSPNSGFLKTQVLHDLDSDPNLQGFSIASNATLDMPIAPRPKTAGPGKSTITGRLDFEAIHSFVGLPLWTRSRFVGIFCLGGKKTGERFSKDDLSLLSTLGGQAALAIYNAQLYEAREQALLDTISALAHAIEAKDNYTINHCENMTGRAVALAQAMGLSRQEVENIRLGAILHDVGKIGIPDAVLNKPGRLTADEYEVIKQHASIGARIVQSVGALQSVVPIVRHHQERYDGGGYPSGLLGDEIPIGARIISVVDAYGAMTEDRIYRKALGHDVAVNELKSQAGKQFDPVVVDAFLQMLKDRPEFSEP